MLAIAYAHQFVKLCFALQAIAEIGIGAARLRRPARFGHGGEARQHQILHRCCILYPFRPEIGLHAEIFCLQIGRHIFGGHIIIYRLYGLRAVALRARLRGERRLAAVDVIGNLRRKDCVEPAPCGIACRAVRANPSHYGDVLAKRLRVAVQHFVPENQLALLFQRLPGDVLLQFMIKVDLQVAILFRAYLFQTRLAQRVALPLVCGTFVAAEMNVTEGEKRGELVNHVAGKLHGARLRHIDHVGRNALPQPHLVRLLGVAGKKLGISRNGGLRMARNVHLGNNLNETRGGISHNLLDIFVRIKAAVTLPVGLNVAPAEHLAVAPCAHFREARIFLYLYAPALVFGQMPVEAVHFINRHQVEHALYGFFSIEMAALIEHEAAPGKARGIADAHVGDGPNRFYVRAGLPCHDGAGKQLLESLKGIEETGRLCGRDAHLAARHLERICLACQGCIERERHRGGTLPRALHVHGRGGAKLMGETAHHSLNLCRSFRVQAYGKFLRETARAAALLHVLGQRNERKRGNGRTRGLADIKQGRQKEKACLHGKG